jgi:hypothetical protein
MREVLPGIYRWELPHPEWTPEDAEDGEGWDEVVASYLVETRDGPVLIDPLVAADAWDALDERLAGRTPQVLITIFWHTRSAGAIADRYPGTLVWAHEPAAALVEERGVSPRSFAAGDALPGGIEHVEIGRAYEVAYLLRDDRALLVGDVFLGTAEGGARLFPATWLRGDHEAVRTGLRESLLQLPIEHLLLTHGGPVLERGRTALAQALDG